MSDERLTGPTAGGVADVPADATRFRRQWLIAPSGMELPCPWPRFELTCGYSLACHPELRQVEASGERSRVILLGVALYRGNVVLESADSFAALAGATDGQIVSYLEGLAGNYVLIHVTPERLRLYTDPGGMMGSYIGGGCAASSPALLPKLRRDEALDREYRLSKTDDWYPGSLCPYVGVRALLANHWLDLGPMQTGRFWPRDLPGAVSLSTAAAEVGQLLRTSLSSLASTARLVVSLTGGRDSRVTLSATRDVSSRIDFFTIRHPALARDDASIPARLAREFHLRHRFVDAEPAAPGLFDAYDEISGQMSTGARREILGACWNLQGSDVIHAGGSLGEVAKGYYWPSQRPRRVTVDDLARVFVSRAHCLRRGLEEWHATVPELPPYAVFNLLYLEQRGGRWAGVGENAASLFYAPFSLFSNRRIFELLCGLPVEAQRDGRLLSACVEEMWPELASIPYGRSYPRLRRLVPKRWRKPLKRILGSRV